MTIRTYWCGHLNSGEGECPFNCKRYRCKECGTETITNGEYPRCENPNCETNLSEDDANGDR